MPASLVAPWTTKPAITTSLAVTLNPLLLGRGGCTIASRVGLGVRVGFRSASPGCARILTVLLTWTDSLYWPGQTSMVSPGWAAATAALMEVNCALGHWARSSSTINRTAGASRASSDSRLGRQGRDRGTGR